MGVCVWECACRVHNSLSIIIRLSSKTWQKHKYSCLSQSDNNANDNDNSGIFFRILNAGRSILLSIVPYSNFVWGRRLNIFDIFCRHCQSRILSWPNFATCVWTQKIFTSNYFPYVSRWINTSLNVRPIRRGKKIYIYKKKTKLPVRVDVSYVQ